MPGYRGEGPVQRGPGYSVQDHFVFITGVLWGRIGGIEEEAGDRGRAAGHSWVGEGAPWGLPGRKATRGRYPETSCSLWRVGSEQKASVQEAEAWVSEDRAGPVWGQLPKATWSLWDFGRVPQQRGVGPVTASRLWLSFQRWGFYSCVEPLVQGFLWVGIRLNRYRFVWFQLF